LQKLPGEELTFESMKRILTESNNNQVIEEEKRMQLSQFFRNAPFQDLVSKTQPKVSLIYYKLIINLYSFLIFPFLFTARCFTE